jgi:homoserine dehydrogenase
MPGQPVIILKFGSSVLTSESAIPVAVHEIYRWYRRGYRVIAVVSALGRTTDKLIAQAREYSAEPDPAHLASFLATGESVSAGLVGLALDRAGVPAAILDPARIGLVTRGDVLDSEPCSVDTGEILAVLDQCPVAVIPGFFGRLADGRTALLGRGGSDLSALFIAHALGARCRLVKDVDGLYESDPNKPGPRPRRYEAISYNDALAIDGRIVQHKAVRFARSLGLTFEVGSPQSERVTTVGPAPTRLEAAAAAPGRPLKVALLGLGTVGLGVYRELASCPDLFEVTRIAVRTVEKHTEHAPPELLTDDPWEAVESDADVIVEAIGGRFPAFDLIALALERGKHVVTANKAVVANDGAALRHKASEVGVAFEYSAAVGGAAPFIESVRRLSGSHGVRCVEGVVNGTTNFILDRVLKGESFPDAVAAAQVAGFAEADPTTDLDGTDPSHKLAILATEIVGSPVEPADIDRDSIVHLDPQRVRSAAACGCVLRLVARAHRAGSQLSTTVRLQTLPKDHPLAGATNEWNRILIHTADGATTLVSGRGAGRWPTTEAVLADLFDVARLTPPPSGRGPRSGRTTGVIVANSAKTAPATSRS